MLFPEMELYLEPPTKRRLTYWLLLAYFLLLLLYINNTDDKTTIISRITGISMATFMLVLQGIAFIAIANQEKFYDQQRIQEARLATSSKQIF